MSYTCLVKFWSQVVIKIGRNIFPLHSAVSLIAPRLSWCCSATVCSECMCSSDLHDAIPCHIMINNDRSLISSKDNLCAGLLRSTPVEKYTDKISSVWWSNIDQWVVGWLRKETFLGKVNLLAWICKFTMHMGSHPSEWSSASDTRLFTQGANSCGF